MHLLKIMLKANELLGVPLLPCCRFHPAEVEMPYRSDFGIPCCLRPSEAGSALGSTLFEATFAFTVVTARQLVVPPRETLSRKVPPCHGAHPEPTSAPR